MVKKCKIQVEKFKIGGYTGGYYLKKNGKPVLKNGETIEGKGVIRSFRTKTEARRYIPTVRREC